MRRSILTLIILLFAICLTLPPMVAAQSDSSQPVVHAVLFYSPTCPHCHDVINNVLIPMIHQYGDQLQLIGIDTTQAEGSQLYQIAIEHFEIPPERRGVPTLIVGDQILVGSGEIPARFPTMVDDLLAAGGIGWPEIPGFYPELAAEAPEDTEATTEPQAEAAVIVSAEPEPVDPTLAASEATQNLETEASAALAPAGVEPEPSITGINEESLSSAPQTPPPDPAGLALAAVILVAMVVALLFAVWRMVSGQSAIFDRRSPSYAEHWLIPLLSLIGLGIAIYLAYVEISQAEAICGPVGQCNLVQASPYARFLGIPIAVLGILYYVAIVILWACQRVKRLVRPSALALLGLTLFGTLFSIYLTLLEIFVIRAVCAWCLSSAVITTALLLLVVAPVTKRPRLRSAFSH